MWKTIFVSLLSLGVTSAFAQELKVTFLGTGAPRPSFERYGPSILVEAGDQRMLVDPSWGLRERIMQVGSFELLTGIDHLTSPRSKSITCPSISRRASSWISRDKRSAIASITAAARSCSRATRARATTL